MLLVVFLHIGFQQFRFDYRIVAMIAALAKKNRAMGKGRHVANHLGHSTVSVTIIGPPQFFNYAFTHFDGVAHINAAGAISLVLRLLARCLLDACPNRGH